MTGPLRGPWFIGPRNVEHDGSVYPSHIANVEGHSVCYIESETVARMAVENPESFWGNPSPSKFATSLLIAAAPDLLEALIRAQDFIDTIRQELHQRRIADWYPEGAQNAADQMSEDMRLLGNSCADFDVSAAIAKAKGESG